MFGSHTNSASKESVALPAPPIVKVTVTVYETASFSGLSDVTVNSMPSKDIQLGRGLGVSTVIEYFYLQIEVPSSSKYARLIRSENFVSVKGGSETTVTDILSVLIIGLEFSHIGQSIKGVICLML